MISLFLVGEPGVGKTTIARHFLNDDPKFVFDPKWTICDDICLAGHYMGGIFDGSDTIPYNGAMAALEYWKHNLLNKSITIFDGDRFSYRKSLEYIQEYSATYCFHIHVESVIAQHRRMERGSNQSNSWIKGRRTKAKNFSLLFGNKSCDIDASIKSSKDIYAEIMHKIKDIGFN